MVEIINSLEDLCRLCARKIDVLMGLNIFASDHREIFKKICICLPIQVSVDDSFPKMVCVECAYKLDLMFDFRERSILTAHLFSDMMTVNSGNVLNVDHSITISTDGESVPEHVFHEEFVPQCHEIPCKIEDSKFNNNYDSALTVPTNEHKDMQVIHGDNIFGKAKVKLDERDISKKCDVFNTSVNQDIIQDENDQFSEKKNCSSEVLTIAALSTSPDPRLGTDLVPSKDILSGEKEAGDSLLIPSENASNISDCSGIDWFFCNTCSKTFATKEKYDEHNLEKHCHTCKCGASFSSEEALHLHISQDHLTYRKKIKQKKAGKPKTTEKKAESKVCKECGKQYQTNYKLQEHMKKHTGEKPFLCSYQDCKKAFRSKIGLAQHEANHSGQFEFSCSTCGKGFQCKSYLVVHQRVHSDLKPFLCKQCSRRFKTKQSLLDHMNRHLGVKPFLCDVCGRGFITKGLCKSHQKVHSGTDNRQYPCHVCRKLFVSKSYLNTHFRIHTGEKPFTCEVCGKGFLTRVDLRIHSTMHTGEKSFVCEMCGKAFARRDALRCHRRSHTGERPYKCEFCGQSFTQFSPMAIHKRLHTGERPYECDVCNKTFVSRSAMLAHRKKHHAANNGVEVRREEVRGNEAQPPEQLVMIEDSPQLLLALRKQTVGADSSPDLISSLHKLKNENSIVTVE